mmetsp:Transcript_21135/g.42649  ORF Transcript_21135/g.42649 Transcript_21135/m.42649 type:complete len:333 (+) Transcript_21135:59-1057(+)
MFDLSFPTDLLCGGSAAPTDHSTVLADWHRSDDPWGAYLKGPGNPATNASNPQGGTVYVPYGEEGGPNVHGCVQGSPGCYAHAQHTTDLAGYEFYNSTEAPHNCVGGSEQGCIPDNPPVADASKTGMTTKLPPPEHWYANGGQVQGPSMLTMWHSVDDPFGTYMVDPGNMSFTDHASHIQGGTEGNVQVQEHPNMNTCFHPGGPVCFAHSQSTGLAGSEFYNNMEAPHNCVGGSEQGCIPDNPPVSDPSKTGMVKALAVPAPTPVSEENLKAASVRASPAHLLLPAHALLLATIQGVAKGDMSKVSNDAVTNAAAVTPVGSHYLRQLTGTDQ